jgi:pimeloyl-ACP methyl ester carboxylesterase
MPVFAIPTLPSPTLINGQSSISPPSAESFDAYFGGFLPERYTLTSELGQTAYYLLSNIPSTNPSNPSAPEPKPKLIRRAILMHGGSTPCINLVPLAKDILNLPNSPPTQILLYDLWGHGLSSTPLLPPTQSLFHYQLLLLLVTLHWPHAHLLGFSASGSFAVSFAAQHPTLCTSVTLVAPVGLLRSSSVPYLTRLVRSGGPWGLWRGAAQRSILYFVDGGQPPTPPEGWRERVASGERLYDMEAVQVWQRESHRGHVSLLVGLYHWGGVFDLHDAYAMVAKGPVGEKALVILGEHDTVFAGDCFRKELERVEWRGDVVEMEDVGHLVVREKPKETAEVLGRYWAKYEEDLDG